MNLTAIAQATLLLTCHFSAGQAHEHQPLSLAEWGRLALWLRHQRMSPADLLTPEVGIRLVAWQDPKIPVTRIIGLLARGHSLALALDKWQRAGLWVVTRADEDYPCRLKATLKNDSRRSFLAVVIVHCCKAAGWRLSVHARRFLMICILRNSSPAKPQRKG